MTNYDNALLLLQQRTALKKQLETKLIDLREQRKVFDRQVIDLRITYRDEQEDVDRLQGKSLAYYFYQVVGKLDDKLTEERREASAARVKLEAAERELAAVDCEIREIQTQIRDLSGCENDYAVALEKKRVEIKNSGLLAGTEILEMEEKIAFLKSQSKEIHEARVAGRSALSTADDILSKLEHASDWNTWDMIGGGGIITHMAKHSHLDDAQELVELLQSQLRKFKTELSDINIQADMQVNIDGFLRFADYFFDGLFTDWAVGNRISESQSAVMSVRNRVVQALNKLDDFERATDKQISILQAKIESLLLNA